MTNNRSKSQRAAEARYDLKRRGKPNVLIRLSDSQARWLEQQKKDEESRADTVARLSGLSDV